MATAKEIEQEFMDHFRREESITVDYFDDIWSEYVYESLHTKEQIERSSYYDNLILPSGNVYLIEDFGGEGQGEQRWVVFSVGDQFFEVSGYYASWDGTTWEDPSLTEVEPKEVVKIEYVRKGANV